MNSINASLSIVIPILLMMVLGFLLKKVKVLSDGLLSGLNSLCFRIFFPVLVFYNICNADITKVWNGRLLAFAIISMLAIFSILLLIVPRFEKNNPSRGVLILSVFRSNFVIFGTIIATALSGEENLGAISLLVALVVPMTNIICVIVFEVCRAGEIVPRKLIVNFFKNPLLIGAAMGFFVHLLPFALPATLLSTVRDISRCATPVSLIVSGGMFQFSSLRSNRRNLLFGAIGRLIAVPGIMLPITVALGFRGPELVALMSMFMGPTAISIFNMAEAMDGDSNLAGQMVVFTSAASVVTMFGWIWLLGQLALI